MHIYIYADIYAYTSNYILHVYTSWYFKGRYYLYNRVHTMYIHPGILRDDTIFVTESTQYAPCAQIGVLVYVYICINMYICIYIYAYMYIHVHTYMYI